MNEVKLREWMIRHIAKISDVSTDEVDIEQSFANYGLDSVAAVSMTSELEDLLKITLSPTLAWDYPNIASLCKQLALMAEKGPAPKKTG